MLTDPAAIAGTPAPRTSCSRSRSRSRRSPGSTRRRRWPARSRSRAAGSSGCSPSAPPPRVPYLGIALVASSALPQTGDRWYEAPMLGIVSAFDEAWLREPLRYLVAVAALALLVIACNAAMFGLSRLGYSLALNRQIPSLLGRLHPRYDTPFVLIALGALLAVALVLPDRPRAARRDLRVRRDARVHDRPPRGDPAALPRARPRPPVQDPVQRPRRAAASCRSPRVARRADVRASRSPPCSRCTTRRASSAPAGCCSASCST